MNASGRRQRQAKNNYNHWAPRQRPNYKKRDRAAAARHTEMVLRREREREQRKSKKK
jgi:hypothetical protein